MMTDDNLPDAVREYQQKFGEGTLGRALAFVPGDCGEQRTSIARYADAAIDALIEMWRDRYETQRLAREASEKAAQQAEAECGKLRAELEACHHMARGWQREARKRSEALEAERAKRCATCDHEHALDAECEFERDCPIKLAIEAWAKTGNPPACSGWQPRREVTA